MDIKIILDVFENYVKNFNLKDPYIKSRIRHSYNVMKYSEILSKRLNLDESVVLLATVIGLLHDIGRFEQIRNYKTKRDFKVNHSNLGVKILFDDKLLDKLQVAHNYGGVIRFAIENHNNFEIKNENNSDKIFFAQILRDANSLDLLKGVVSRNYIKNRRFDPYAKISQKVKKVFFENKPINRLDIENSNEFILMRLSYIYMI